MKPGDGAGPPRGGVGEPRDGGGGGPGAAGGRRGRAGGARDGDRAEPATGRVDLIEGYLDSYRAVRQKILRQLLLALHARGFATVDRIYAEARRRVGSAGSEALPADEAVRVDSGDAGRVEPAGGDDPRLNRGMAHRWEPAEREAIEELTIEYAARHFTAGEIDAMVILARKRDEAESLMEIANLPDVSFELLHAKLREYTRLPGGDAVRLPPAEAVGVRVAVTRRFISEHLDFLGISKAHLRLRHLERLMAESIGCKGGTGRLGGKAAGMVLARCILEDAEREEGRRFPPFLNPDSVFLRTDLFQEFLRINGLMEYYDQKYRDIEEVRAEFAAIREVFKNAEFPPEAVNRLREALERFGPVPLIVRSSSLLEDNFDYAFAGKYASIFLGNQGTLDERLTELLGAIAEVYASTFGPDPISYRKARNLIDYDEMMGVIVQKVVGRRHGRFFLPLWAGVAFSRNEYRWNKRIRREDGLLRVVMGLGSRAVDRVGGDYPRMVALGLPTLRPEANIEDVCRYSQRYVDAIDLQANAFKSVPVAEVLQESPFPDLDKIVSVYRDRDLATPLTKRVDAPVSSLVVTFDKLLAGQDLVPRMRWMLSTLATAYRRPVDVEFAFDGESLYILQCRPLTSRIEIRRVEVPADVREEEKIFGADRDVPTAQIDGVEYVVLVDPKAYDRIATSEERHEVAVTVGAVNRALSGKQFILMGPGRWGSSDDRLGVRVTYADIGNTRLLVEIAYERNGYVPEVSFGTHFFQDLVEAGIYHLPLYPDRPGAVFNCRFLFETPSVLPALVPDHASRTGVVRVIHVPAVAGGRRLRVVMDGTDEKALAYLT
jgi:hypothetical protein